MLSAILLVAALDLKEVYVCLNMSEKSKTSKARKTSKIIKISKMGKTSKTGKTCKMMKD